MPLADTEQVPQILIISRDAGSYADLLPGLPVYSLGDDCSVPDLPAGATVVLGEPDLAAAMLPSIADVAFVQSTWAGLVPLLPAAASGIRVCGIKDVFGPQMAEYTLGYMLVNELKVLERMQRQADREWFSADTGGLAGKRLGVMGTGSIGQAIASKAGLMDMKTVGLSRSGNPCRPFETVYPVAQLPAFLEGLDYLVSVLPQTPETNRLLDERAFRALPDQCVIINVGRGNVIDDAALVDALDNGRLAGAVLDVFNEEPLPQDHPFWEAPNLTITAHVAARSYPEDIAAIFRENYARFVAGEVLKYQLDTVKGY